ncbi:hypothetical protein [Mucilaginibacter pedocola]|nr:hypothetical protein [Mucilaginibacter pedocola]
MSTNAISVSGILGTREFFNSDVKGFRVEEKAILIYAVESDTRRIMINDYDAIGNSREMIGELEARYPDLNAIEYQASLTDILQSDEFGISEDERRDSLSSAGRLARFYNIFGLIVLIGSVFFIEAVIFSDLYSVMIIIYPLVGIVLMVAKKGLIKFATKRTSPIYSLYYSMFISCIFLVVKPLIKYNLIDLNTVWVPMGIIAGLFFGALYWKGKADAANAMKGQVIMMVFVALVFGVGFTTTINCMFDTAKPQTFTARIDDVYITRGKRTIYHVTLGPWGLVHESKSIQVPENVFYRMTVGNNAEIELRQGLLGMPWYQLKN